MELFSILQLLGWLAVGLVMTIFALTGGFDFGAGILLPFIGKTDDERRMVVNTVGPTWDGNQVWLITAGGAIFAIWPRVYAASFSGFYFAFLLVLWALFFRPVAFEYRSKLQSFKWRQFWDWCLFTGSLLPALLIGVGVGNLFLGLPFQYDPESLRFFYGHGLVNDNALLSLFGLLRPFALLAGIMCVLMMIMHGASYLALRTQGEVYLRAKRAVKLGSVLLILVYAIGGIWLALGVQGFHWQPIANPALHPLTNTVTTTMGGWLTNYATYPWMLSAPILGFMGAIFAYWFIRQDKQLPAFLSSSVSLFGILGSLGFSLFPFIMPSLTAPQQSLIVWNATSSQTSLIGILITALIMLPIIFIYTMFVYRKLWGRDKMSTEYVKNNQHVLY